MLLMGPAGLNRLNVVVLFGPIKRRLSAECNTEVYYKEKIRLELVVVYLFTLIMPFYTLPLTILPPITIKYSRTKPVLSPPGSGCAYLTLRWPPNLKTKLTLLALTNHRRIMPEILNIL
jgi:hypothetical protein